MAQEARACRWGQEGRIACLLQGRRQYLAGPLQHSLQAAVSFQPWILYREQAAKGAQCR